MKITIIAVGKIKEKFYRQAVAEFEKRLSRYVRLSIIETVDEKTPDGAGEKLVRQIKDREGQRILRVIQERDYVIALAIEGEMPDSPGLAEKLRRLAVNGTGSIVFVIGGSLGLSDAVMERANESLSFSRMTFPHQLMRVILLEQIYRAYRIINGEPYHK